MTDPAPKPIAPLADRIRDVADQIERSGRSPIILGGDYYQYTEVALRAIASELEEKAEEMRNEWYRTGQAEDRVLRKAIDDVARWADSLARRKDQALAD